METIATKRSNLPALTSIRFFAALYVVFYHFVSPNLHTSIWPVASLLSVGYSAVGFFFILSGFILTYSYLGAKGPVSIDSFAFWRARFSRIYPAYLFAFLLAAPFQIWGSIHVNGLRVAATKLALGAALHLTLLQAWTPWTAWYWNIPAWSLSAEAFFYLCFPSAALLVGRLRSLACFRLSVAFWLLGLLVPAIYCLLRPVVPQPPFAMPQLAIETNPLTRLPEFLVGVLVGRIFVSGFRFNQRLASVLSFAALAGIAFSLTFCSSLPRLLLSNGLVAPLSALLIFALAHQSGLLSRLLSHSALVVLGEASYAIYVLQFPISYLLHLNNQTFTSVRFSLYLIALIAVSVLTFYFIEQPLRRRLRALGSSRIRNTSIQSELTPQMVPGA